MTTDTSQETGPLSMKDAISLLSQPSEQDTVDEGRQELEEEAPALEADADVEEEVVEEAAEATEDEAEGEYDEEEVETEEEVEEPVYTVRVDEQDMEVTLDELLKGYSRQQSYTKRSMELAEQRKAFEAEQSETKQLRDAYAQQLEMLQGQIQQTLQQEPDWAALAKEYSAEQLFLMKAEHDKRKENLRLVEAERRQIAEQQAAEQQQAMQKHLSQQREDMLNRIPEWKDEDTRNQERLEVIKYAQQRVGFSEEEIANASDARAIELLYKAWKYDQLVGKKPEVRKKVRKAPKMAKAGQPKTKAQVASRQRRQALGRLDKERSVDAAVNYLMGR